MIRIKQIKVNIEEDNITNIKKQIINKIKVNDIEIVKIVKKSIDARDKENIYYIYEVDINTKYENKLIKKKDIIKTPNEEYIVKESGTYKYERPIIIGSGPAGLFAGYLLALKGYKPLIIERGEKVEDRVKTVEDLFENNKLNTESNIQFGEGGAGTFSDGKLNTLVKDKDNRQKFILKTFVECGANPEILYLNKPHIGTDILRKVIINLRNKIISLGGEFKYNSKLTNIFIKDNSINQIEINNNEIIDCKLLILAIGHSARDTFKMLNENKLKMIPKPFAVGIRIEHKREMINKSQYGKYYKILPSADYKLTYTTKDKRGVYSFCMCPGGFIVNASSEETRLAINGMSNNKRDSINSNSAIVVTVNTNDFGNDIFSGLEFQRKLEEKAYNIGKSYIPVELYEDYKNNKISNSFKEITPSIKGKYNFANINEIFPDYINKSIKEGIEYFATKIEGFNRGDSLIYGVESRTSSPIRIERDEEYISNIKGIYPCGEGAGYAGGITSAAMDGLKVAESIIKKYKGGN